MNLSLPAAAKRLPWSPWLLSAAASTVIGLLLTWAVPDLPHADINLVFSWCIGLAITGWTFVVDRVARPWRWPLGARIAFVFGTAALLGYVSGVLAARALLGFPLVPAGSFLGRAAGVAATVAVSVLAAAVVAHRLQVAQARRLAAEAELRALRAQLDPHMLFNTLAHLRALVEEDRAASLAMIDHLIPWLRGTLAGSAAADGPLELEFERLAHYLEIMAIRLEPRLAWRLDLPDDCRALRVPALLLQPLVENALRHGVEPQAGPAEVVVSAVRRGTRLCITVADTGAGLPAQPASAGHGLRLVRERLAQAFGDDAQLRLEAHAPRGTRAVLELPA